MCGIVAYIGHKPAEPILLEGLKRLEYRGYDSAGMAVINQRIQMARTVGRVRVLQELLQERGGFTGTVGIAHTRWATHGEPSERNAHPHRDDLQNGHGIALFHNGIIENYVVLRTYLQERGHTFTSDTDTEVLTHLIGELYDGNLEAAVQAIEVVDECVGRIVEATLRRGGSLIVTADHGNAEQMWDTGHDCPHTAHTTYDVPLIVVGEAFRGRTLRGDGRLADIAPTVLAMMGLEKPPEMTGRSLLEGTPTRTPNPEPRTPNHSPPA